MSQLINNVLKMIYKNVFSPRVVSLRLSQVSSTLFLSPDDDLTALRVALLNSLSPLLQCELALSWVHMFPMRLKIELLSLPPAPSLALCHSFFCRYTRRQRDDSVNDLPAVNQAF